MKIFLSGFMGCGKTTVGKHLSQIATIPFYDLDVVIEEKERKSVEEIFADRGEPFFRDIESKTLGELTVQPKGIIALGGGTTMRQENLELVKSSGILIYLHADTDVLHDRLKLKSGRPLVDSFKTDEQRQTFIEDLLSKRIRTYKKAHKTVNVTGKPVKLICNEILGLVT